MVAVLLEELRQRDGVGSALMAHVLTRVDAEHLPAYVENSKARNLDFYERHGFVQRREDDIEATYLGPCPPLRGQP